MPTTSYSESGLKDPSKLIFQTPSLRRTIILAYWIIIILAIPLWWSATSIERLSLNTAHILELGKTELKIPIRIYVDETNRPDTVEVLKSELARRVQEEPDRWDGLELHIDSQKEDARISGMCLYQ